MGETEHSEEEGEYIVEAIIGHRKKSKKFQFLIRWQGYKEEDDTWEYEKNLDGCSEILMKYKEEHGLIEKRDVKNNETKAVIEPVQQPEKETQIEPVKVLPDVSMRTKKVYKYYKPHFSYKGDPEIVSNPVISVLGAYKRDNDIFFNVEDANHTRRDLNNEIMKSIYPDILFKYYESITVFENKQN